MTMMTMTTDTMTADRGSTATPTARDDSEAAVIVQTPHRYVVVEGPIGVGKTSLARRLGKSFGCELVLEQDAENPFLERFYRDPKSAAFQTQLYFLFQRARQLQDIRQADLFEKVRVADYMLDKDRLFARLTLDEQEYALYEQVYARLAIDAPAPDLIVYLQAPVDVLLDRIARRGIAYEQQIERRYLERLNDAYARFFLEFDAAPLLIVNAADIDPLGSEADYEGLLAEVVRPRKGRHYFNPLKSLL
ncbi:MAG TPA: deoxynucleoside kinase [Steroidobacteraceae bacterium]|jgi:deoxyguanosine kinase|nr:deoxynucleoside kinase [Steroidobacteraceae bacterium]